jgi:hypothetical protein
MGTVGLSSTVLTVQTDRDWRKFSVVPQVSSAQGKNTWRGQCWFGMVCNPFIAVGYPVPWRDDASLYKGLEVSLELMVAMSRAEFPTTFGGKFMLKGIMSALFPTASSDHAIIWHFMINTGEFSTLAVN